MNQTATLWRVHNTQGVLGGSTTPPPPPIWLPWRKKRGGGTNVNIIIVLLACLSEGRQGPVIIRKYKPLPRIRQIDTTFVVVEEGTKVSESPPPPPPPPPPLQRLFQGWAIMHRCITACMQFENSPLHRC